MPRGVVILPSYYEAIKSVENDSDRLQLLEAIIEYGLYDAEPQLQPMLNAMFCLVKPNIDTSIKRYTASVDNGKKGGRPRKNQTENQTENQRHNQDKDLDYDTDLEKEFDKDSEKENILELGVFGNQYNQAEKPKQVNCVGFDAHTEQIRQWAKEQIEQKERKV